MSAARDAASVLIAILWLGATTGCSEPAGAPGLTPIPTQPSVPTDTPTLTPVLLPTASPTILTQTGLSSSVSNTLPITSPVDYGRMILEITRLVSLADYDVGVAFVDTVTGQAFTFGRDGRFHAMSTFKGPLAVYYLALVERGMIQSRSSDRYYIEDMLEWSANPDTTCIFRRVGGLGGFNDWMADQGLDRQLNFVYQWNSWYCNEDGQSYVPRPDRRYRDGDPELGLPGDQQLLYCPDRSVPCDKAFRPLDLAMFYARVYRGEILSPEGTAQWLEWMRKPLPITSMFDALPEEAQDEAIPYTKNGFYPRDARYDMNFYHEAGLLQTPYGAFALAVFMQGNPEWRGTDIHGQIGRIAYDYFIAAHRPAGR